MTGVKQFTWIFLILFYLWLNTEFQIVDSSGRMFIKLKTYEDFHGWDINGQCCDGTDQVSGKCQPCDHYISACLKDNRDHGNGPCISNIVTTYTVNDTNNITFGQSLGNVTNPFVLNFTIPTKNVELSFSYYDDDRFDTPPGGTDFLENTTYVVYALNPDSYTPIPFLTNGSIPTNRSRLSFDYNLQCDEHYYDKCDRYCFPDPVRYTCSSFGRPICNSGWSGTNCTTFDFCSNATCKNGATCQSTQSDFHCNCPDNYTGRVCESQDTSPSTTHTPTNIPANTTTDGTTQAVRSPGPVKQQENTPRKSNAPVIAGVTVGIIAALAAAVGGVVYYLKRKKSKVHNIEDGEKDGDLQNDDKTETKTDDSDQHVEQQVEQQETNNEGQSKEKIDATAVNKNTETKTLNNTE